MKNLYQTHTVNFFFDDSVKEKDAAEAAPIHGPFFSPELEDLLGLHGFFFGDIQTTEGKTCLAAYPVKERFLAYQNGQPELNEAGKQASWDELFNDDSFVFAFNETRSQFRVRVNLVPYDVQVKRTLSHPFRPAYGFKELEREIRFLYANKVQGKYGRIPTQSEQEDILDRYDALPTLCRLGLGEETPPVAPAVKYKALSLLLDPEFRDRAAKVQYRPGSGSPWNGVTFEQLLKEALSDDSHIELQASEIFTIAQALATYTVDFQKEDTRLDSYYQKGENPLLCDLDFVSFWEGKIQQNMSPPLSRKNYTQDLKDRTEAYSEQKMHLHPETRETLPAVPIPYESKEQMVWSCAMTFFDADFQKQCGDYSRLAESVFNSGRTGDWKAFAEKMQEEVLQTPEMRKWEKELADSRKQEQKWKFPELKIRDSGFPDPEMERSLAEGIYQNVTRNFLDFAQNSGFPDEILKPMYNEIISDFTTGQATGGALVVKSSRLDYAPREMAEKVLLSKEFTYSRKCPKDILPLDVVDDPENPHRDEIQKLYASAQNTYHEIRQEYQETQPELVNKTFMRLYYEFGYGQTADHVLHFADKGSYQKDHLLDFVRWELQTDAPGKGTEERS